MAATEEAGNIASLNLDGLQAGRDAVQRHARREGFELFGAADHWR